MNKVLRQDAEKIARAAIAAVTPDAAVNRALRDMTFPGRVYLVSVGKAGWQMARAALDVLDAPLSDGVIITKYGHVEAPLPSVTCFEAGHPIPDENGVNGTAAVLAMTAELLPSDTVLFLLSGGGSALFEKPLIPLSELQCVTNRLLAYGADITEMNIIRKRLSAVKGGQFARHCAPATIKAIVLSDILGDPPDMVASGPAYPDSSTCQQAKAIVEKYHLQLTESAHHCLERETPKELDNVETNMIGSVRELCLAASAECEALGYRPVILTDRMCCEAREAGSFFASMMATHSGSREKVAFIAGGETVVHLRGSGLGGRNQELALAAAREMAGISHAALISVGSDGTDGPTDAAGGYVDGDTLSALSEAGLDYAALLADNDAYHALKATDGLIITGPTGTNVNDVTIALLGL